MRIWGYVLLIIGIVFLLLFVMAELGGGHVGIVPFFVSGFLILMGWRMRNSGQGLVQSKPAATAQYPGAAPAPGPVQGAAPAAEFSTVEMPLTPDVAAAIAAQNARRQRVLLYVGGGFFVFFILLGIVLSAANVAPGHGPSLLAVFAGIGVATVILMYGISWLTVFKPVRRDLQGTIYLRTTGPVKVVTISSGGMLRLADRAFLIDRRNGMAELMKLGWGRVDYSPHGHVILAAWDSEGRNVYSLPGYTIGSGANRA